MIPTIHFVWSMTGQITTTAMGGSIDKGCSLVFLLYGSRMYAMPPNKVYKEFAKGLEVAKIDWIKPTRDLWIIDLDGMKAALDASLHADWMCGKVQVEPDIIPVKGETFGREHTDYRIFINLIAEDVQMSLQRRIFLSHKTPDKAMVRRFHQILGELGFEPWLDEEDMPAGTVPHRGMQAGMEASCAAIFFVTPDFKDQAYLSKEINDARTEHIKRPGRFQIITLSMADAAGKRGTVPNSLTEFVYKQPETEIDALREILRALPLRVGPVEWRA